MPAIFDRVKTYTCFFAPSITAVVLTLVGCVSSPVQENRARATAAGAQQEVITGTQFRHVVYGRVQPVLAHLNIYFGGDGAAWLARDRVSTDPTADSDLALSLMLKDTAAAYYVARPCYHGTASEPPCSPFWWTSARFSSDVVESLVAVVGVLQARHPQARLRLIGYSGGGTLALLVARELTGEVEVVTLASPLDVAAWAAYHQYTPLSDSLDPARVTDWTGGLRQVHLMGEFDLEVPAAVNLGFRARVPDARFVVLPGFNHHCCWLDHWPDLIDLCRLPDSSCR